jgi:hypothetical protein
MQKNACIRIMHTLQPAAVAGSPHTVADSPYSHAKLPIHYHFAGYGGWTVSAPLLVAAAVEHTLRFLLSLVFGIQRLAKRMAANVLCDFAGGGTVTSSMTESKTQ